MIRIFNKNTFYYELCNLFLLFHAAKHEKLHENTGDVSCLKSPLAMMLGWQRPGILGISYPGTFHFKLLGVDSLK